MVGWPIALISLSLATPLGILSRPEGSSTSEKISFADFLYNSALVRPDRGRENVQNNGLWEAFNRKKVSAESMAQAVGAGLLALLKELLGCSPSRRTSAAFKSPACPTAPSPCRSTPRSTRAGLLCCCCEAELTSPVTVAGRGPREEASAVPAVARLKDMLAESAQHIAKRDVDVRARRRWRALIAPARWHESTGWV